MQNNEVPTRLTKADMARRYGNTPRTIMRWVKLYGLPCYQPAKYAQPWFDLREVEAWERKHRADRSKT